MYVDFLINIYKYIIKIYMFCIILIVLHKNRGLSMYLMSSKDIKAKLFICLKIVQSEFIFSCDHGDMVTSMIWCMCR